MVLIIKGRNLKEALKRARARYRGNLVVDTVRARIEREYVVTLKPRVRHPRRRKK